MLELGQKLLYKAFGLNISSDIFFSELEIMRDPTESIDVEIKVGYLDELNFEQYDDPVKFVFKKDLIGIEFFDIATFSIQEGRLITVSPMEKADKDQIRLFILGTCMGILLLQRKVLPLHGSTVAINGKAYAFIGESGAGKSTLASAFLNQGFQLLTDDVIAVTLSENNIPLVIPSYPQQKLWQESLEQFGMQMNSYMPIYKRETKFAVPVERQYSSNPIPLAGIFELVQCDKEEIELIPISNLKKIRTLFSHTYRNFIISELGLTDWHFKFSTRTISHIDMFQLKRPPSRFTADELVSLVLDSIHKEERKKC